MTRTRILQIFQSMSDINGAAGSARNQNAYNSIKFNSLKFVGEQVNK